MSRRFLSVIASVAALALTALSGAIAHETAKGPHGGPVVDIAGHHVEFVPSATEMTFYLTGDADAPIASAGAKMKAIVQVAGKTTQIELAPVEPNKLVGKLVMPLAAGAKVVLSGALADGHTLQARFVVP